MEYVNTINDIREIYKVTSCRHYSIEIQDGTIATVVAEVTYNNYVSGNRHDGDNIITVFDRTLVGAKLDYSDKIGLIISYVIFDGSVNAMDEVIFAEPYNEKLTGDIDSDVMNFVKNYAFKNNEI